MRFENMRFENRETASSELSMRKFLRFAPASVSLSIAIAIAIAAGLLLVGCGQGNKFIPVPASNQTGFIGKDGKQHTGAGSDAALAQIKQEIAGDASADAIDSIDKEDRDLASQILEVKVEELSLSGTQNKTQNPTRVHVRLRDSGAISFIYTDSDLANTAKPNSLDVRYKSVVGKTAAETAAEFEAALLCRFATAEKDKKRKCPTAIISLKEKKGANAKAGMIVRSQDVTLLARSAKSAAIKNETLKRVTAEYKESRDGMMQSFEVAWGASGFDLDMGDSQLCPSGRLVETNDLDEPLRLSCPNATEGLRGLEGRMIGNTTRGELFLEILSRSNLSSGSSADSDERIFILVRKKKAVATTSAAPGAPASPGSSDASEKDKTSAPQGAEEDEDLFLDEDLNRPLVPIPQAPAQSAAGGATTGWIVPINLEDPITKHWARDRKRPSVAKKVDDWKASTRFKNFINHFLPNRDLVFRSLQQSRVPGEFSFITLIESQFFIKPNYPIEVSSALAVGPWQFMPRTASDARFGLKVFPVTAIRDDKGKLLRHDPSLCDERADLGKSTEAAGKYFRVLLNMFPRDPRLAVAAYNWGEGNVECLGADSKKCNRWNERRGFSEERLSEIRELGLSFWAIHRFNMAPSSTLNYVIAFIAAHHAALEMEPMVTDKNVLPWKPTMECRTPATPI